VDIGVNRAVVACNLLMDKVPEQLSKAIPLGLAGLICEKGVEVYAFHKRHR